MYEDKIIKELKLILYTRGRSINMKMNEAYLKKNGYAEHLDILMYDVNVIHSDLKFTERLRIALFDCVYIPTCRHCGINISHKWDGDKWATVCSKKCAQNDSINKAKMLAGQENVDWDEKVKLRCETMLERTGYEHQSQIPSHKAKIGGWSKAYYDIPENVENANATREATNMLSYGVPYLSQMPEIQKLRVEKATETRNNKSDDEKFIRTQRYRISMNGDELINKLDSYEFMYDQYITQKKSTLQLAYELIIHKDAIKRSLSLHKINLIDKQEARLSSRSIGEIDLFNFIKSIRSTALASKRFSRKEVDIFIPEMGIGIEYNGIYWHSELHIDQNYHKMKSDIMKEHGIRVMYVWEDDWNTNKDVVKKRLMNVLLPSHRVGARKFEVVEIKQKEFDIFVDKTHMQGSAKCSIRIALIKDNIIHAVMGFKKIPRNETGAGGWILSRFSNTNVDGAFGKLIKYFETTYSPILIRSYADLDIVSESNNIYLRNSFIEVKRNDPDYKYYNYRTKKRERKTKWRIEKFASLGINTTDKTERELALEYGLIRCYDSGKIVYEKKYV